MRRGYNLLKYCWRFKRPTRLSWILLAFQFVTLVVGTSLISTLLQLLMFLMYLMLLVSLVLLMLHVPYVTYVPYVTCVPYATYVPYVTYFPYATYFPYVTYFPSVTYVPYVTYVPSLCWVSCGLEYIFLPFSTLWLLFLCLLCLDFLLYFLDVFWYLICDFFCFFCYLLQLFFGEWAAQILLRSFFFVDFSLCMSWEKYKKYNLNQNSPSILHTSIQRYIFFHEIPCKCWSSFKIANHYSLVDFHLPLSPKVVWALQNLIK